ncbi:protocadherin fat-like protein [Phytophthora cinnamomi]|uniref:protocadherin fat-like protein n=1 Tax=Phytophthora cinnamomi TaxID=4785 RepID=UPI0035597EB1|nr:protocadherin fat-like protein [Phytophthora cinnamomi]
MLCRPAAGAPPTFATFASARPTNANVELVPFLPSVVYDNLDGDRTATLVTPSAGVLVAHANYRTDPRYYTENVLESRLNYPTALSPYVKISYASKPMTATAYKVGQGATFQKDFDAAAAPVETDGFCERELFALGPLLNTQSDLCGRFKQVDTNVGFLLQLEFVEPSNAATNWVWYLGLPFRLGNGAVVVLDGVVVQDLLGKTGYWKGVLEKSTQVAMKITPGFHVLRIYGLTAKFEPTSVYFSREGSAPAVVSVAAMVGELTKWVQFVASDSAMTNTLTTEQANKASSVGRGVSLLQFQNVPVEGRIALHLGSLAPSDSQVKPFEFAIDELRLWSTIRSPEEIKNDIARSVNPTHSGLLALYRFNGDLADTTFQNSYMVIPGYKLDLSSSLVSVIASDASDFSAAMDGDTSTTAFVGLNMTTDVRMWVEFEFKNEVDASKVILDTGCTPNASVFVVEIQYWNQEKLNWKPSPYFTNTKLSCSRYIAYAPEQYVIADDDDTGNRNLTCERSAERDVWSYPAAGN